MARDNDLLQASLSGTGTSTPALYSATSGYITSFIGGPIAGAIVGLLNARRLNRLSKDWWIAVAAIAVVVALLWWQLRLGGNEWLSGHLGERAARSLTRVSGAVFFGGVYALHYRSYRSMSMFGVEGPSGWIMGIVAVLIGGFANLGLEMVIKP